MTTNTGGSLNLQDIIEKDILEISGGANLPQEEKEKLYDKIMATIRFRTLARIDEYLLPEQRKEWKELIDKEDFKAVDEFIASKGIKPDEIMVDEAIKYKIEIATYMEQIKNSTQVIANATKKIEADLENKQKGADVIR
jgi:hypothetical protein